ncbi:MAG: branched-chain amino acid transport system II carrier protein [Leeuwenhoekiella sp.]
MTKQTLVVAFAIFSLFFGAGNLVLPPYLGYTNGLDWQLVAVGFAISAVVIPILGIMGHARLQGTMLDFANKVHPVFSLVFCSCVYLVAVSIPVPRTAAMTYEMGVEPYFTLSSLGFSTIYFILVLVFALNRSRLLNIIGKYLTPILFLTLLLLIGVAAFSEVGPGALQTRVDDPFSAGFMEGYQTFDAMAAIVVGAVVIISLKLSKSVNIKVNRLVIARGGILAGLALLLVYAGLIYIGHLYSSNPGITSRTELLAAISGDALGKKGLAMLGILIGVACFTTATGAVTGTADFVKGICNDSQRAYTITAIVACLIGVLVGQFEVDFIIAVAVPALYLIYPVIIVLILLNVLPERFLNHWVFKSVIAVTVLFYLPDFLESLNVDVSAIKTYLPLAELGFGWMLPSLVAFVVSNAVVALMSRNS